MDENGGFTPIDGHYNGKMVIFAAVRDILQTNPNGVYTNQLLFWQDI